LDRPKLNSPLDDFLLLRLHVEALGLLIIYSTGSRDKIVIFDRLESTEVIRKNVILDIFREVQGGLKVPDHFEIL
jgi:hypothetical protein